MEDAVDDDTMKLLVVGLAELLGIGALGVETKNLVLQLQALKPITAGFDSFKNWDDVTILLGAGLRF